MRTLISLFIFSHLWLFAPAQAAEPDEVTLLLNWYLYSEHAPFFLGKERGMFAEQGIDLEIQEGRGSGGTVQAVAAETVQFGYADVGTMIKAAAKGAPVRTVGVLLQTSPMSVMGLTEKNIRTPEDIKGKIVAVTPGDSMSQIWPLFMQKTGLQEGDFKVVAGDAKTKLNAVINGQADLLLGYLMDQNMRIHDATGKDVHVIPFADYGVNLVSSGVIVSDRLIEENPELIKRFMAAATQAVQATVADPEAAVDAMLKAQPNAGQRETLLRGLNLTMPLYHTPDTQGQAPFKVADNNMVATVNMLIEYGGVDAEAAADPKAFYTTDYLP